MVCVVTKLTAYLLLQFRHHQRFNSTLHLLYYYYLYHSTFYLVCTKVTVHVFHYFVALDNKQVTWPTGFCGQGPSYLSETGQKLPTSPVCEGSLCLLRRSNLFLALPVFMRVELMTYGVRLSLSSMIS